MAIRIMDNYRIWLDLYGASVTEPQVLSRIREIAKGLKTIKSANELVMFLDYAVKKNQTSPLILNITLVNWKKNIEQIIQDHKKAVHFFNSIPLTAINCRLVHFLSDLISDPQTLLDPEVPRLLNFFNDPKFLQILIYILFAPPRKTPLTAEEIEESEYPVTDNHAAAIRLHNNLSAKNEVKNLTWHQAQCFMHVALAIYKNINMTDISLEDMYEQGEVTKGKQSTCNIV